MVLHTTLSSAGSYFPRYSWQLALAFRDHAPSLLSCQCIPKHLIRKTKSRTLNYFSKRLFVLKSTVKWYSSSGPNSSIGPFCSSNLGFPVVKFYNCYYLDAKTAAKRMLFSTETFKTPNVTRVEPRQCWLCSLPRGASLFLNLTKKPTPPHSNFMWRQWIIDDVLNWNTN